MDKPTYTKLGDLVDSEFTVLEAGGYTFKRWNDEAKRFEVSDNWQEGFRKIYAIKTDKGILDLGSGQLSSLLEATYYKGVAEINNKRFSVKSNGKSGMDIRYFFNLMKDMPIQMSQQNVYQETKQETKEMFEPDNRAVDLSEIPF